MVLNNRVRAIIKDVKPEIDCGRFPIKRVIGEKVDVEAVIFTDGHDSLSARLLHRKENNAQWIETPMDPEGNDLWKGFFTVDEIGVYLYTITAWVDRFKSWRIDLAKRVDAGQENISANLLVGLEIISDAKQIASDSDIQIMQAWMDTLQSPRVLKYEKIQLALSEEMSNLMHKYPDRKFSATYSRQLSVVVDREKARFSSWYEMFPRSCSSISGSYGNFKDCEKRIPYIAEMGFDILYLPPIHPIGHTNRKGKNNTLNPEPNEPGTPWAIGSEKGGHKDIHPELGTFEDFHEFISVAANHNIEVALDMAFQCSPDHPYVKEHPEWFYRRPDGTIQFAENPPKKYEDIYPLNFESDDWKQLWQELKSVILFWIDRGISIFRVDNPHTKPFHFWEWLIGEVKKEHPEVIFLAEAFTRPNVMYELAKLGFSQSYTYFAWRNTKWEITQYFNELTKSGFIEYFRPNLWPNTPDILTEFLQSDGRAAFMLRLVLAATLSANYGIYGPAFELCENRPKEPGSEEYMDSEKYEIKHWDITRPDSLKDFIARVNRIRRENKALQHNLNLDFHEINNESLICYSKHTDDLSNIILVAANLDPYHTHSGWLELPLDKLGIDNHQPYQVHDLLSGARFLWNGPRNYVELNPGIVPVHILRILKRIRTEQDFDYYL